MSTMWSPPAQVGLGPNSVEITRLLIDDDVVRGSYRREEGVGGWVKEGEGRVGGTNQTPRRRWWG
jgi:hypothetical protein